HHHHHHHHHHHLLLLLLLHTSSQQQRSHSRQPHTYSHYHPHDKHQLPQRLLFLLLLRLLLLPPLRHHRHHHPLRPPLRLPSRSLHVKAALFGTSVILGSTCPTSSGGANKCSRSKKPRPNKLPNRLRRWRNVSSAIRDLLLLVPQ